MPDADIALAKKRLARDLILVIVQVVGLCAVVPDFFVQDVYILVLLGTVGVYTSLLAGFWGCHSLYHSKDVPFWLRVYGACIYLLLLIWFLFILYVDLYVDSLEMKIWEFYRIHVIDTIFSFHGYCLLPQFFISRWLAKAAEEHRE
jgi:hypothetical protein